MAMQAQLGVGILESLITEKGGVKHYAGDTDGNYDLPVHEQVVFITDHASADKTITLPPVLAAEGRTYYFYKIDASTQSVLIVPHGFISSTLNGGDSANWDGSTGYDMDAQYDHLVLQARGGNWIAISNGIA